MNHQTTLARVMALDDMTRHERSDAIYGGSTKGFVPSHKIIQYLLELQRRRWISADQEKIVRPA
ncbi:MAG: hypothetical protein ACRD16_02190 [Thermoanaerobaculia bacterium]